jgi:hypothetical protein
MEKIKNEKTRWEAIFEHINQWNKPSSKSNEITRWKEIFEHINPRSKFYSKSKESTPQKRFGLELYNKNKDKDIDAINEKLEVLINQNPRLKAIDSLFKNADTRSLSAQNERVIIFKIIILCGALAIILQQLYSSMFPYPAVLGLAIISGLSSFFLYRISGKNKLEERYIHYRGLAEACRVQFYWSLMGHNEEVIDHFLFSQRNTLEWIRQAVGTLFLHGDQVPSTLPAILLAKSGWTEDQSRYFKGTGGDDKGSAVRESKAADKWGKLTEILLAVGFLFYGIVIFAHIFLVGNWISIVSLIGGLFFATAAICKIWNETLAHSEHASRFQRAALLFEIANKRLVDALQEKDATLRLKTAQEIFYKTGKEALDENSDWILLHEKRPLPLLFK